MPEYTLKIRRYDPSTGEPPYWEDRKVELEGHRSVLDGILDVKAREDGSIGIRCSCQAAICGSCGVRINGQAKLACNTKLSEAAEEPDGFVFEELGECLLALNRPEEARTSFARAYELLSKDEWFAKEEGERLGRMKRIGGLA